MPAGRPLKYETAEALEAAIEDYFASDDAYIGEGNDRLFAPTISGLAYHLDIATETLRAYGEQDKYSATVKRAKQKVEISLERRLHGNAVTGAIFNLKNNFGWKDKSEQEISGPDGGAIPSSIQIEFIGVEDKTS